MPAEAAPPREERLATIYADCCEALEAGQVEVVANLFFHLDGSDMLCVLGTGERRVSPMAEGVAGPIQLWRFAHNWRDVAGNKPGYALPLSPGEAAHESVDLDSRDPAAPGFLRPRKDSALAQEWAGQDDPSLPPYAGAVSTDGA